MTSTPTYTNVTGAGESTEADAIADLAMTAAKPEELDLAKTYSVIVPAGAHVELLDLEDRGDRPFRKRGTAQLTSGDSFTAYVKAHGAENETSLFADIDQLRIVAVLNGHLEGGDNAGWGDHRAHFTIRHTPEWKYWTSRDGRLGTQVEFAEHVEAGLLEIVNPDSATMLELAQTFHAKTSVDFKSATRLDSGERQFRFEEEITATAGRAGSAVTGQVEVPETFDLAIPPFEGAEPLIIRARLRYRLNSGNLAIGYQLDRPNDAVRAAFEDVVKGVEDDTGYGVYRGTPPAA